MSNILGQNHSAQDIILLCIGIVCVAGAMYQLGITKEILPIAMLIVGIKLITRHFSK